MNGNGGSVGARDDVSNRKPETLRSAFITRSQENFPLGEPVFSSKGNVPR